MTDSALRKVRSSSDGVGGRLLSSDRVVQRIRERIVDGHYGPGSHLSETGLASDLSVGRAAVREALQVLAVEGLVTRASNRGAFVVELDTADVFELYELREALEVMATRLAAERATARQIAELSNVLDRTAEVLGEDPSHEYPAQLDLHTAILTVAGNQRLLQRGLEVHAGLRLARSSSGYRPGRARKAYDEHVLIVEAIVRGDPDTAEIRMREHLRASLAHVQAIFAFEKRRHSERAESPEFAPC